MTLEQARKAADDYCHRTQLRDYPESIWETAENISRASFDYRPQHLDDAIVCWYLMGCPKHAIPADECLMLLGRREWQL